MKFPKCLLVVLCASLMAACSSGAKKNQIIPESDVTVKEVMQRTSGGGAGQVSARGVLVRPASEAELLQVNHVVNHVGHASYRLLPNPTLHIYFAPQIESKGGMPKPAWMSEFKMYDRDHYALPGELSLSGAN
ncbi:hypothetical protein AB4571_02205 [Vibrio breoganii]|uniref:hypothetical protein n=1 Tax=Vibrio breoganii TaxID=553239 RepID=UPI000C84E1C9|nr:hypothetical protein [Vibrio breoganii]PML12726.1 hypothetical protein BCT84_02255 [Vibrio breoganii]